MISFKSFFSKKMQTQRSADSFINFNKNEITIVATLFRMGNRKKPATMLS